MLEEQAMVQNLPALPKRSRKFFPTWNPGNGLRKYHSDRTFRTVVQDAEAGLQQDSPTPSGLREEHTLSFAMGSHPSQLMIPHSSSPLHVSPVSASGASSRCTARSNTASRDYTTLVPPRRKSQELQAQYQKHICLNRERKMERLERMVVDLQREVLFMKQKVQQLEATSLKAQELPSPPSEAPELFNGYTREQLKEAIRFDQKISTACKTLLYKLFTSDYIQSHSITGRRGNTFREPKPMMDERCVKIIRVLLKQKFGDHLSDTTITEKIQNVQKALRQKLKTDPSVSK